MSSELIIPMHNLLTSMRDLLAQIDLPSLLLGVFLSTWYSYFLKRPKLEVTGGSSTGGGAGHWNFLHITNSPGILGIVLRKTILFGKKMHGNIRRGLVINRDPAHECQAWLYEKGNKTPICRLTWFLLETPHAPLQSVTLKSGDTARLGLFARKHDETVKYFPYQPSPTDGTPIVPPEERKLSETKEFVVEVKYLYGLKTLKIPVTITKELSGRLTFKDPSGSGSF